MECVLVPSYFLFSNIFLGSGY